MDKLSKSSAGWVDVTTAVMSSTKKASELNPLCGTTSNQRGVISRTKHLFTIAALMLVALITLASCGNGVLGEGKVKPKTLAISGPLEEYLEIVDGVYQLAEEQDKWSDSTGFAFNVLNIRAKVLKPFTVPEGKVIDLELFVLDANGTPITGMTMPLSLSNGFDWNKSKKQLASELEVGKGEVFIKLRSKSERIKGAIPLAELEKVVPGHYKNFMDKIVSFEIKSNIK